MSRLARFERISGVLWARVARGGRPGGPGGGWAGWSWRWRGSVHRMVRSQPGNSCAAKIASSGSMPSTRVTEPRTPLVSGHRRYVLSKYVTCVTPSQRRPPRHKTTRKASKNKIHFALQNLSTHQVKTVVHQSVLLWFSSSNLGKIVWGLITWENIENWRIYILQDMSGERGV